MFHVKLSFRITIADCPESGLPAVDFRRERGLPDEPSNIAKIEWEGNNETLCRTFAGYLGKDADLILKTSQASISGTEVTADSSGKLWDAFRGGAAGGRASLYGLQVPAAMVWPFVRTTAASPSDVVTLLRELLAQADKRTADHAAEQAERENREAAEQAERKATRERAEAEKAAKLVEAKQFLETWVARHGSELAKLRLAEGYECWYTTAREEWADAQFSRFRPLASADDPEGFETSEFEARKCPTVPEILALREVRALLNDDTKADLVLAEYSRPSDEDEVGGVEDDEVIRRTEIRIILNLPGGGTEERFFLIPS